MGPRTSNNFSPVEISECIFINQFSTAYKYSLFFVTNVIADDSYFLTWTSHCQHNPHAGNNLNV